MTESKPKVAFFDFAGCEGCQLTVLDALQTHPEILDSVEILEFREAMSEREEGYQIAFVEGSCVWPFDEDRLRKIRERADIVVALGACAHLGGVNAIRNVLPPKRVAEIVYEDHASEFVTNAARPIEAVIQVDAVLPGCPIDRKEFLHALTLLLQGTLPSLNTDPVCVECRLRETRCLLLNGEPCLGPITRGGCGAICPTFGVGCEGCRGLLPDANLDALEQQILAIGLSKEEYQHKLALFLTQQLSPQEITT
jgi:sulfhydrogenase subunit delta